MAERSNEHVKELDDLLSAYADGELSPQEKEYVEELLRQDKRASTVLEEIRFTKQALSALPRKRAPRPFTLSEAPKKGPWARPWWRWAVSAAALVIVVAIGLGVFMRMYGGMSASPAPRTAAEKPSSMAPMPTMAPEPTAPVRALSAPAPERKGAVAPPKKNAAPGATTNSAAAPATTPRVVQRPTRGKRKAIPLWMLGMAVSIAAIAIVAVVLVERRRG